jgi:hypothetical protein
MERALSEGVEGDSLREKVVPWAGFEPTMRGFADILTLDAYRESEGEAVVFVGGGGEIKTLRLVAQYGDACNLFTFLGADAIRAGRTPPTPRSL